MRRIVLILIGIAVVAIVNAQTASFTQTIRGTVIDEQSGNILGDATITVEGMNAVGAISDSLGNFKLVHIPIGRQTIRVSLIGYEDAFVRNIEVTSSKEVVLEIRMKEQIKKLNEVVVTAGRNKSRPLNDAAVVSARQFSMEEAVRYAGSRNDPSRMAQNFAGVSGANDARNDIIIRGNSPAGVLWRMEGIDIPNPNHYSTLGSTGGPVTILNTNTLKNSDFLTGAFPAQYGNALAGVFDLRMRDGNSQKYEFLGQMGFNGFELGAEGPFSKSSKASFLIDYRYSLVAVIQQLGLTVGTGAATPYYQDLNFKVNVPTKKFGTFSWFGIGGESHIKFDAIDNDNLYVTDDGSLRDRTFRSLTGATGLVHTLFFDHNTSGKFTLAVSGFGSRYEETFYNVHPDSIGFYSRNTQIKYSAGYTFNKKISSRNQLTAGINADLSKLTLSNEHIADGDSALSTFINTKANATLLRGFVNFSHRFTDKLGMNLGLYDQLFTLNNTNSIEPRWNIKYQFRKNQSIAFGAGLHSQVQPLEVYFFQTKDASGEGVLTNKNLDFTKSTHGVLAYDINVTKQLRLKAEVYGQYIFNVPVEKTPSSFSMLNTGADFYFPYKTNLVNNGKGYNYGLELTLERFLDRGYYFLVTGSLFDSRYKASDGVWRNTAFNSHFTTNFLAGKEIKLNNKTSFGIDTKFAIAGGQRYTPFDLSASEAAGYVVFKENEAYSAQNDAYLRWDLKFSFIRNGKKTTQKWYIDLQNLTNKSNVYVRTLNPKNGNISEINQIGFFPNVNYMITF